MPNDTTIYFCRYFRYKYLLKLVPLSLFRRGTLRLYYLLPDQASERIARKGGGLFNVLLRKLSIERYPVNITGIKDPHNRPIMEVAYIDSMDRIMDNIEDRINGVDSLFNHLSPKMSKVKDDLKLWIKHHIAWPTFDLMLLVEVVAWAASNPKSKLCGEKLGVIIDRKDYGAELIMAYAREKGISVLSFSSRRKLKEYGITFFVYQLFHWIVILMTPWRGGGGAEKKPEEGKGTVCTFHYGPTNFCDYKQGKNYNLFWFFGSGIPPEQILIFSRMSQNMDKEEIERVHKAGFQLWSCDGLFKKTNALIQRHRCSFKVLRLAFENIGQSLRLLLKVNNKANYELWRMLSLLFIALPYWEDFFAAHNVKIFFKPGAIFSEIDIASKLAGAATVSYQYSNNFSVDVSHHDSCDIFFIWGKVYQNVYRHRHAEVKNFIQSGYVFDYIFEPIEQEAAALRDSFTNKGVKFILGVFDENLNIAHFAFVDGFVTNILLVYKALFEYALQDPTVAIIAKPKKVYNVDKLKASKLTSGPLQSLEKEGRIKFLEAEKFPVVAGKAADLSIGVSSNSAAALECWFAGAPAIFYDSVGMGSSNPDYALHKNNVIFDNITDMMAFIDDYRNTKHWSEKFADWSRHIKDKNTFWDGQANQRIGFYIKTLLEEMDRGLTKEMAIEKVNRIYGDKFGADKVMGMDNPVVRNLKQDALEMDYERVS